MGSAGALFLGVLMIPGAGTAGEEEKPRRMTEALKLLIQEDAKQVPEDPKLESLTAEERDAIVPAREVDRPPTPPKPSAEPPDGAVALDKVMVEETALTPLELILRRHDHAAAKEAAKEEPSALDRALNHPRLSIFGSANAAARAADARYNGRLMRMERLVLVLMEAARTEEEKAELRMLLKELERMHR